MTYVIFSWLAVGSSENLIGLKLLKVIVLIPPVQTSGTRGYPAARIPLQGNRNSTAYPYFWNPRVESFAASESLP